MKILYLGSNLPDTDLRVSKLALSNKTINHGLVTTSDFIPEADGYYHTTIVDVWAGGIIEVAKHFDKIVLLDQPVDQWSHWKALLSTYKIIVELEKLGYATEFRENDNIQSIQFMWDLLQDNKAFCVYPWMHLLEEYGDGKDIKNCYDFEELGNAFRSLVRNLNKSCNIILTIIVIC